MSSRVVNARQIVSALISTKATFVYRDSETVPDSIEALLVGHYHLVAMTLNSLGVEPETDDFPLLPA